MSKRVFYRRGQRIELEQLDAVVALPVPAEQSDAMDAAALSAGVIADDAEGIVASDVNAFRRAGWLIVAAAQADAIGDVPAGEDSAPVFRDHTQGRLLIGTHRLTVKFKGEISAEEAERRLGEQGLRILRPLAFAKNLYQVQVGVGQDALDIAATLQNDAAVEYAEPEMIEHLPSRLRPSDPQYARQWQWNNDGSVGGTQKADVRAEEAWDTARGRGIRVAVIDNGFDVNHPDLASGLDPATAHFVRTPTGDAVLRRSLTGFPNANHGTFCAGMVGARADNTQGGCGAAPEASLMLIACLNDQVGTQVTLARAVGYAADPRHDPEGSGLDGADIIACSLGPNNAPWGLASVLEDALTFAATEGRDGKGIAIFWAVDNAPNPVANDEVCSHATTIAVGRSTRNDRENGSAFGPELDFLAPGVDVFSTTSGGGYGTSTGTSYAAPCAAGVAALVLEAKKTANATEVRRILRDTCNKVGGVTYNSGRHPRYGFGRINAAKAVAVAMGILDDQEASPEMPAAVAAVPVVGPQLPSSQGGGECQWTAPSLVTVRLQDGAADRELEVSVIDGRAVFEGDIVLTRGLETLGVGHSDVGRRWPNRTLVYDIHPALTDVKRVTDAIAHWEANTVIKFKKREQEKDYVLFRPGGGCSSAIGKIGGVQFITLGTGCSTGNVIHEIGHAVGLWHEQSREDRDTKITIKWENISPEAHHNFRQQIEDGDDIDEYDFGSIMHYPATAFSINGLPTIVPKEPVAIGQREKLSDGDIQAVAQMYASI
jgi:thermitase